MIPEKKRGLASHFVFPYNEQQENPFFPSSTTAAPETNTGGGYNVPEYSFDISERGAKHSAGALFLPAE